MAHEKPYQIGSRKCGCVDCVIDYPPDQYGLRTPVSKCIGPWQVRYISKKRQHLKSFTSPAEADAFLAELRSEEVSRGA
ncbi:hypothetical protein ACFCV8_00725 [Streptomyces sp. NPDC056347]|uniref:hypothetical protein n=1 Tax=Streptomyces sp. NPDC056347 TaxID=3345790 RepID=UPI0035DB1400